MPPPCLGGIAAYGLSILDCIRLVYAFDNYKSAISGFLMLAKTSSKCMPGVHVDPRCTDEG